MRGDLDIQIASESSKAHGLTPRDEPSKLAALLGPPTRRAGGRAGLRGLPRGGAGECALELRRRAQRPAGRDPDREVRSQVPAARSRYSFIRRVGLLSLTCSSWLSIQSRIG